jgi:two-component system, chemotaxis family, chemotaxis protein CheY
MSALSVGSTGAGHPLVLVVDDDPDILDAVCEILEAEGYRVSRARNGREALERVELEQPAVILLDLMMPVMDGSAFAQALRCRPRHRGIPIVLLTAAGSQQKAVAMGASGYLAKPFEIEMLLSYVAGLTRPGVTMTVATQA